MDWTNWIGDTPQTVMTTILEHLHCQKLRMIQSQELTTIFSSSVRILLNDDYNLQCQYCQQCCQCYNLELPKYKHEISKCLFLNCLRRPHFKYFRPMSNQSEVCRRGGATAESQLHMSTSLPNPLQSQRRDCQEKIWDKIGEVMPHIADPPTGLGRTLQKTLLAICDVIWGGLLACCPNAERKDVTKTFLEMGGACLRQSTNTAVRRHCTDWYEI